MIKTDFFTIKIKERPKGVFTVYPDFRVRDSQDIIVKGKGFYGVWDEEAGEWTRNEYRIVDIVDREVRAKCEELKEAGYGVRPMYAEFFSSNVWNNYKAYLTKMGTSDISLDDVVSFKNTKAKKTDYISRHLPYDLEPGDYSAWDKLVGTLYKPEERQKIEWAIGAIVAGDQRYIQKFFVFYGEAGSGKSTILNIIQELFEGYWTAFEAKALASSNAQFSTEAFRDNPLVAIQHDGDLSRIEDNTRLNSIVSHETMEVHEKYKSAYNSRFNCFLFMGTNRPVKITDARSGIIRRLIDITPSGDTLEFSEYEALMSQIHFELGAIAYHCLEVYRTLGRKYYNAYTPFHMISTTDPFFNYVEENMPMFLNQDVTPLRQAWDAYKTFCDDAALPYKMPMNRFKEELKMYFRDFREECMINGKRYRSAYIGFKTEKMYETPNKEYKVIPKVILDQNESVLDGILGDCKAQYATADGKPKKKWEDVTTTLKDLDTAQLHYVMTQDCDPNMIVIDFDLKNEKGEKDLGRNLEAAAKLPPTYTELSQGGHGVHLHYIYDGDVGSLSRVLDDGIEIKVFSGNSSLRRKVIACNNLPVAHIKSGLPLREAKSVINYDNVASEKSIRERIMKCLNREYHPNTAPSVSLIYKILEDAYNGGSVYDVTDLRPKVLAFANSSHHQSAYCVSLVAKMHFKSEAADQNPNTKENYGDDRLVFFDVEVFPNLFLINWKYEGTDKCVRMINPTPQEVGELFKYKLVGFNNRRYDNHMLYARYIGYDNMQLFMLSQKLVNGSKNAMFSEAYNISYTDVYDFASNVNKKSLKKFEVELRIHHQELGLPWDEEVPEEKWEQVAEYCDNDVISTEIVFNHLRGDWIARQILAKLSGLTLNDTTNQHSQRVIFGKNKTPQAEFNYRNLAEPVTYLSDEVKDFIVQNTNLKTLDFTPPDRDGEPSYGSSLLPYFPGYTYDHGKSVYRGVEVGEGGYVFATPGIYYNVALLDVESMHPSSVEDECLFGPNYTKKFSELKLARVAIKHKDYDKLREMLDGNLSEFVDRALAGEFTFKDLSTALKTVINSVYGLTSASFDNPFRDTRNKDNIVAKRGALFMVDLMNEVQKRGFTVAHIKTDSIKIPNATPEIIKFVMDFGLKYGYKFEHEATYEKMCLINDAVYIAKVASGEEAGHWSPTGARFAHPYVFKTLFSKENLDFYDLCETKNANVGYMYLDFNEDMDQNEHNYVFIGKTGLFCPVVPGAGGGILVRFAKDKYDAVSGTKGYRWMEAEVIQGAHKEKAIDLRYFRALVDDALDQMRKFGDVEAFLEDDTIKIPPWCTESDCATCDQNESCSYYAATFLNVKGE